MEFMLERRRILEWCRGGGGLEARRLWRRFSRRTSSWPGLVVEWVSAVSTVANELI